MRALIGFCIEVPRLILLAGLAVAALGIAALVSARYDVFPEFGQPTITVETLARGLAPKQIEGLVTTPVEDALIGTPALATLRSVSQTGLSLVTLVFRGGTNVYRDQANVAARLGVLTGKLPRGAVPAIAPPQSSTGVVMSLGLRSERLTPMQLTGIARWVLRPALLAVPGVSKVVIFGAMPAQLQVRINPARMAAAGVGLRQVIHAAHAASAVLGAGEIDTANQQLIIIPHGQARDARALAAGVLADRAQRKATPIVTLGDVAHVTLAPPPPLGGALVGTHRGLLLVIGAQYGANTLRVTHGIDRALARAMPALRRDGVIVLPNALRPAAFVISALHHLRNSLLIGAALIAVVLLLALRNWRSAAISFVAIPLSLLIAVLLLQRLGFSLNTLSLGGLAIAIGEVVDDAVVDVENIHRRLRENRALPQPRPARRVVLEAAMEVRGAIVFATVAVVLVFLPVLGLSGVAGRLFTPLALAYIGAILASLLVALTVTPALAWLLLGAAPLPAADPPAIAAAKRAYLPLLMRIDRHAGAAIVCVTVLILAAFASTALLAGRFLPNFHERQFILHFHTAPGTSLATTLAVGRRAIGILQHRAEVATAVLHAGHADLSNGHAGTNKAEIDLTLTRAGAAEGAALGRRLLGAIKGAPGVHWSANTFLVERIRETLSGHTAPVVVSLFGSNLTRLDRDAAKVARCLRGVRGAAGVRVVAPPGTPEVSVRLNRAALALDGLTARRVLDDLHTAYAGDPVGRVYANGRSWPIVVVLPPARRADPAALGAIPIRVPGGGIARLGSLARIRVRAGRSQILHQGGRRVQVVTAQVNGGASGFLARARPALAALRLAHGDYLTVGGTATASRRADLQLLLHGALALVAVVGLMALALRETRLVVLLAVNIPFALVGGIAAVWITGLTVSLGAAVGFVTVFGITLRNALMLLSHYRRLVRVEGHSWTQATARLGAAHRLAPILMTASVTALGLLPIALGAHLPGQEIEGPMAIVILGGLCSSTVLTLLVLPVLAGRFARIGEVSR